MLLVRLLTDPFDLSAYTEHSPESLLPFLHHEFPVWPEGARLYKGSVAVENDVTPRTEDDIKALAQADGEYWVVVYPEDIITLTIALVVAVVALAAIMLLLAPKIPTPNTNSQSSNNTLGTRVNKPRPKDRIEEIFGSVISVPTLLAVPLLIFESNLEQEICWMCVGRGDHEISDVRDGDTPIASIAGAGVKFYGPYTSPNFGAPILSIGSDIDQPLMDVVRVNEVNGQVLKAPNSNMVSGDDDIRFVYPDTIERSGTDIDFTKYFAASDQLTIAGSSYNDTVGSVVTTQITHFTLAGEIVFDTFDPSTIFSAGDFITISNAGFADTNVSSGITYVDLGGTYEIDTVDSTTITLVDPDTVNSDWPHLDEYTGDQTSDRNSTFSIPGETTGYNVDGTYTVLSVTSGSIVLDDPATVNSAWNNLDDLPGDATDYISPTLSTSADRWVGPFIINMPTATQGIFNFIALQGMYRITKKGKDRPTSVEVEVEVTPCDEDGVATGAAASFFTTVEGDGSDKNLKGETVFAEFGYTGRVSVRARRLTPFDEDTSDTVVDEVKWRDAFGTALITQDGFGDVTTVHTRTYATAGATSVKERKLNCRATRKVLERNIDNTFGPALVASQNAADIICHMALDPYIGGRTLAELDVDQLYDTVESVVTYFAIPEVGQFNYTFDQDNISFEEMVQTVAQTVFCRAYRQGSKLRLFFERATEDSTLLFNHRNKVPATEVRTARFGYMDDNDGVEMSYISPVDGAELTIYLPEDQSAVKPKKISVLGVQSEQHAFLHAARSYNRIRYKNMSTKFTATGEATQLVISERIEVTDNTRPDVNDGHITEVDGLTLTLSQPFVAVEDVEYVIFIQQESGLDIIDIEPGLDQWHVVLQSAPTTAITIDPERWADVLYQIVGDNGGRSSGFLVARKGQYDPLDGTLELEAINYDSRYYQDDSTYL